MCLRPRDEARPEALGCGLVDKLLVFVAPKIIGGAEARTAVGGAGVAAVEGAWQVRDMRCRRLGDDFMIEGYLGGGSRG